MADREIRRRANIGIPSLILVFIILCLVTFALHTLSNAKREDFFSRKNADSVQEYYRADGLGVDFVAQVDRALAETDEIHDDTARKEQVLSLLGIDHMQDGEICADIPMSSGLALRVGVAVDWEKDRWKIQQWTVYDRENYEIDQSVPVWTGEN